MKKSFRFRLIIAIIWILLIYTFLPFGPKVINFFYKQLGVPLVRQALALISIAAALFVYLPFIKKFRLNRAAPYIAVTVVLIIACAINISLKAPARTLHIPEYLALSVFLYRAFIVKYTSKKSCALTIAIAIFAGIIDERIIQYLLPMRVYDFTDILLNTTGVIVGVILISAHNMPAFSIRK